VVPTSPDHQRKQLIEAPYRTSPLLPLLQDLSDHQNKQRIVLPSPQRS
jgi:hypothetical protein